MKEGNVTLDELAAKLDQFGYDFDPYDYMDAVETREEGFEQIREELPKGHLSGFREYLTAGFLYVNDVRRLENMDLVPEEEGGNLFLVKGSMTPLRSAGASYQTSGGGSDPPEQDEPDEEPEEDTENKKPLRTEWEVNTAVFLPRAKQMGLKLSELEELDEGTVMDMNIESGNGLCDEECRQVATQEDFNSF
jgi:hypothetical protein